MQVPRATSGTVKISQVFARSLVGWIQANGLLECSLRFPAAAGRCQCDAQVIPHIRIAGIASKIGSHPDDRLIVAPLTEVHCANNSGGGPILPGSSVGEGEQAVGGDPLFEIQ